MVNTEDEFNRIATHIYEKYACKSKVIGLGSGSTISSVLTVMAKKNKLNRLKFIPSSLQIRRVAESLKLEIADESKIPDIDFVMDGADQIDSEFSMIKGGGGALLKEKILIDAAEKFVIICHAHKFVNRFNVPVPIEVHRFARATVIDRLQKLGLRSSLRVLQKGFPYITESGNVIYDSEISHEYNVKELERSILLVPGVIEVGLFRKLADSYYKLNLDGTFTIEKPSNRVCGSE